MNPNEMEYMLELIGKGYVSYDTELRRWRYKGLYVTIHGCASWQELMAKMKYYNAWMAP